MAPSFQELFMSRTGASAAAAAEYLGEYGSVEAAAAAYERDNGRRPSVTRAPQSSSRGPRVATMADLQHERGPGASSPGAPFDPDRLFTGGEKSGLAVQNPASGRGRPESLSLASEILRKAREQPAALNDGLGAQQDPFAGHGFRLGSDASPSADHETQSAAPAAPARIQRVLTFWQDGFSIEDGPLYRYDDPRNARYLEAINQGRAPLGLMNVAANQVVDVRIDQRDDTPYEAPGPRPDRDHPGFTGSAHRLGSALDAGEDLAYASSTPPPPQEQPPQEQPQPQQQQQQPQQPQQDTGEGDTLVQLRLASGAVLRRRFESSGSVQELYDFVDGHSDGRGYRLQTTFPNRTLDDRTASIASADIKGSVIVQHWT